MNDPVRLALVGAGLIGHRHADAIRAAEGVELAAVVDPNPVGGSVARQHGTRSHVSLGELWRSGVHIDGVIVATPNQTHAELALACIAQELPVLVEKPLADTLTNAERIWQASESTGVPVLVGHHRRYNGVMEKARELVDAGSLGRITNVQSTTWLFKPEDYFEATWRRLSGAGPLSINLIHDVDALRYLCGEVASVQAMASNAVRGFEVEDSAAIVLRFSNGALGTMSVSDTTVAPLSWELTARENPAYPATNESCYQIGGTHGSLSLPGLTLWTQSDERSWWHPISGTRLPVDSEDPLIRQIKHFAEVIRGNALPRVTAADGVANQRVIQAITESSETRATIELT